MYPPVAPLLPGAGILTMFGIPIQERGALSRLVFGAAIALIIGVGALAAVGVSALVSGDAGLGTDPAVERPERPDTQEPPQEPAPPEDPPTEDPAAGIEEEDDAVQEDGPTAETAVIRVMGDEIDFRGAIRSAEGTRYVGGVTPARYVVPVTEDTRAIRASFQKQGEPGTMTVQIVSGGEVVAEDEITPSLGRASLTWEPGEE